MYFFLFGCTTQHVETSFPKQIESEHPALEAQSLNYWTTREVPHMYFFLCSTT